jgi:glucose/arabinose dehydrogenase
LWFVGFTCVFYPINVGNSLQLINYTTITLITQWYQRLLENNLNIDFKYKVTIAHTYLGDLLFRCLDKLVHCFQSSKSPEHIHPRAFAILSSQRVDTRMTLSYHAAMKFQSALLSIAATLFINTHVHAQSVPSGFSSSLVTAVTEPTAIAFTPDGRMLITSQGGALRVFKNGSLLGTAALTFNTNSTGVDPKICTGGEQGLLGVAVDPAFATNKYIYLFYTARNGSGCGAVDYTSANPSDPIQSGGTPSGTYSGFNRKVNRVSRFVLQDDDTLAKLANNNADETVLVDRMPARGTNHNAGDVHFGKDGFLYVSIGDGGTDYSGGSPGSGGGNNAARDKHVLTGKILRITRDGGIPPGNPFTGANTGRCNITGSTTPGNHCQETFAWGLRNPFRFAMDPNAANTRFYINDVGQGVWEEINESVSGADYGWNDCEGSYLNGQTGVGNKCNNAAYVDPRFEYQHGSNNVPGTSISNCNSITGGAFVPNGIWPSSGTLGTNYEGTYLFADYVCGAIFKISGSGLQTTSVAFATNLGGSSATSLGFGPDLAKPGSQALYYTSYTNNPGDGVWKISYSASGNAVPTVSNLVAAPSSGNAPLSTLLTATAIDTDPLDTLTYFWDFGDGTQSQTTTNSTNKTFNTNGSYIVSVRARDDKLAFSTPRTVTVQVGNTAPIVTMTSPAAGSTFSVGQTINMVGSASDPPNGNLPDSALSWRVILHHDTHTHPFFSGTGNNLSIVGPAPEDLAAAGNSYLEFELTATDSGGLQTVVSRDIQPLKITLNLASSPSGRKIVVNNSTEIVAPQAVTTWSGWNLPLTARDQNAGTSGYTFSSWSDAPAQPRSRGYVVPTTSPANVTVNFTQGGFVPSLDIDNNGQFRAANDGIVLMRYMLGFRGNALIANNVVGANAERGAAQDIENYIASVLASFNVDGRAGVNAATDGVLIVRYLLGISNAPLTNGTSSLNDAANVTNTLDGLKP